MSSYKEAMTSHLSDNWSTPKGIYDFFVNDKGFYDPCPLDPNGCDALLKCWGRFNFVNPPYSDLKRFIEKSLIELDNGNLVVLLLPFRPDTNWFSKLFRSGKAFFLFITGRLVFGDSNSSAPFPSIFVCLDPRLDANKYDLVHKNDIVDYFSKYFLFCYNSV